MDDFFSYRVFEDLINLKLPTDTGKNLLFPKFSVLYLYIRQIIESKQVRH